MTLFVGPVGDFGGPAIKNRITLQYLNDGPQKIKVINTLARSPFHQAACAIKASLAPEEQVIVSVSAGGRRILYPMMLRKKKRNPRLKYSLISIGGTVAEEASENWKILSALKNADLVSVETEGVAAKLRKVGLSSVHVMTNFVDDLVPSFPRVAYNDDVMRFVFLSSVRNQKGIATMLAAFRLALECGASAVLDIYGPIREDFDVSLFEGIDEHSLPISYKGIVDHKDIPMILHGYHCFLFPSEFKTEGFPAVLAEAMAAGLPVIASDVAYNTEIICGGTNGIIFPAGNVHLFADAIVKMCHDRDFAKRVSRTNSSESMRFDAKTVVSQYGDALRKRGWIL